MALEQWLRPLQVAVNVQPATSPGRKPAPEDATPAEQRSTPRAQPAPSAQGLSDTFWEVDPLSMWRDGQAFAAQLQMDFFFEARRFVMLGGQAGPIHPRSFRVQLRCRGRGLDPTDHMIVPFHEVREQAQRVVNAYHSQLLNDLPPFANYQPTTENLAAIMFYQFAQALAHLPVEVCGITLWESPTRAISYDKVGGQEQRISAARQARDRLEQ